jgi:acyl carrier protein
MIEEVCAIVARQLGRARVEPQMRLVEDLAAESLDIVTVAAALEARFGVEIPDAVLYEADRVSDLAVAVAAGLSAS